MNRFMAGRNGQDLLGVTALAAAIVSEILFSFTAFPLFMLLSTGLLIYSVFRMLSRNVIARQRENYRFRQFMKTLKMRFKYHIYKCPNCGKRIRIPRKFFKKVEIRCPSCGTTFVKRI